MIAKLLAYLERDYLEESARGYWIFLLALCMAIASVLLLLSWPLEVPLEPRPLSSEFLENINAEEPISLMDTFFKTFSTSEYSPASTH